MKLKILRTEQPPIPKVIKAKKTTKKARKTKLVWNTTLRKWTRKKIKPRVSKLHNIVKNYVTSVELDSTKMILGEDLTVQYMCPDCYDSTGEHDCKIFDYEHNIPHKTVGEVTWKTVKSHVKDHDRKIRMIISVDMSPKDIEFLDITLKPSVTEPPPLPKTISSRIEV